MKFIREIIEKQAPSLEELIDCFEKIKMNGEVAVIKFDGERDKNEYTVFISFPNSEREMIRSDETELKKAIMIVLAKYIEQFPGSLF